MTIEFDYKQVQRLASQGLTKSQIARCLGIAESTLYKKQKTDAEFSEAIKRGQAEGIAQVTNDLMLNARRGNVTAQIFYLKNRDPENWRDRKDYDHTVTGEVESRVINAQPELSPEEWQKQYGTSSGSPSPDPKPH